MKQSNIGFFVVCSATTFYVVHKTLYKLVLSSFTLHTI